MIFFKILIISLLLLPRLLLSEDSTWKYLSKTNNGRAFISQIKSHENEKKYITFVVMYDSYKGLTAANGAKYFSKKENYTVNCKLKEFLQFDLCTLMPSFIVKKPNTLSPGRGLQHTESL